MSDELEDYREAIATNARLRRQEAGLTQVQVTMRTGIPQTTLSKIERFGQPFTLKVAYRLVAALGCSLHDIIPARSSAIEAEVALTGGNQEPNATIEERLARLERLLERGLVTAEEYREKRTEVLDDI